MNKTSATEIKTISDEENAPYRIYSIYGVYGPHGPWETMSRQVAMNKVWALRKQDHYADYRVTDATGLTLDDGYRALVFDAEKSPLATLAGEE